MTSGASNQLRQRSYAQRTLRNTNGNNASSPDRSRRWRYSTKKEKEGADENGKVTSKPFRMSHIQAIKQTRGYPLLSRGFVIVTGLAFFASFYNLITIPMNVAWTCNMATTGNIMFNYVLDTFFLGDTICECFRQQTDEFGFPVVDAAVLTNSYLFERFGICSVLGSIPWDVIAFVVGRPTICDDHSYLFPNAYEAWAYIRMLRLIPAWKAVVYFVNIDVKGLSTPLQRLIKTMAFILGVIHISACIFWKISMYSRPREGWIWVEGLVLDDEGKPMPLVRRYIKSFYSAQLALFFQNRDLRTDLERAYSIIETLLAAMIFGGLLGLIMALIKSTVKTVASKQAIEDGMIEENIKRFMDEVMKHIRYKANMMKGMELGKAFAELPDTLTEDIYLCLYSDLINSISLFKNTDISFRMSVIRALTPLTLPSNTTIFSEGEEALDLYFIRRGCVELQTVLPNGSVLVFDTLKEHDFLVGETSIMQHQPRMATAVTTEETELCVLSRAALTSISSEWPTIQARLVHVTTQRHRNYVDAIMRTSSLLDVARLPNHLADRGRSEQDLQRPKEEDTSLGVLKKFFPTSLKYTRFLSTLSPYFHTSSSGESVNKRD
ncbi:hypothetical protein BC829DRAFT_389561 [Chytridium lagenaria]|nr:hypothetical protein BC829DRAFT_389561 [Chytridium lagenaria]